MAILDSITANLAYGFRLLKTGVTYACRVKNTTTNVETDLAPGFSKATADALVSAGQELVVIKFYDQTGSGNHLDSVGSNHGKLKFDGLEVPYLEKTSSYPDIRLRTASNLTFTAPKFFSLVYFTDNTDGWFTCMSNTVAFISRINSGNLAFYNGNGVVFGSLSTGNWHQITSYFQSGADKAFVNGTERTATSGSDAGDTAQTAKLCLLRQDNDANGAVQGRWREIIYIEGTVSDVNRAAIEADQVASLTPPDTTPPAAITDLTYDSKNSTSITGHFTAPTDASGIGGYEIRVNGGSWTSLSVTGTTTKSFTKTGLTPGTSNTLEVRSYDGAATPNYSAASNSITQTTWQTGPTITETSPLQTAELDVDYNNPIAFSDGDGTVTITVKSGYSLPSGFSIVGNALVNSNPSSLVTNHATRLIATDSKGQTHEKDFTISVVDTTVPTKVTGVVADVISVTQIDVDSDAASDASGIDYYQTRIADNEGMSVNVHVYDHDNTAYSITSNLNPANNKSYWVQQRAIDNNGLVGAWSDAVQVSMTVPVSIPTSSPLSPATIGQTASGSFAHAGGSGSGTFSKVSGEFPTGISMNTAGARSGTFTAEGEFSFRLRYVDAEDSANNIEKDFVWNVSPLVLESEYSPDTSLEAPVKLTFTELTDGTVTDQRIKFGDYSERIQADDANFSHVFLAPGTYKFERWAKINGVDAYETYEIVIGGDPPTPPTATAIEFDEIELNRFYSEGAIGGPEYSTNVLGNPLGVQQRNANRPIGLHSFELNFEGLRFDEDAEEKFDEFLDFFHTRQGALIGFRFFPFVDNRWNDEEIAKTDSGTATYNLIRTYKKAGRERIRRIVKPVPDLIVTINDDPATDYSAFTIDYREGRIIFADEGSLPDNGSLKVTGQYCIPVVFATDKLPTSGFTTYVDLMGLRVVELPPAALGISDLD